MTEVISHTLSEDNVNISTRTEKKCLGFQDTCSMVNKDFSFKTKVYRKDTHTDWYTLEVITLQSIREG